MRPQSNMRTQLAQAKADVAPAPRLRGVRQRGRRTLSPWKDTPPLVGAVLLFYIALFPEHTLPSDFCCRA